MDELTVNRELTAAFIARRPVTLTLTPRVETSDGAGGKTKSLGTPRAPQVFSLLEPSDSGYREPAAIEEGRQSSIDFMLLGTHDAIIGLYDVFTYDGREYKVVELMPDNGYEKRALVMRHGW